MLLQVTMIFLIMSYLESFQVMQCLNRHPCLSISLSQTIATFGKLDILVSNAAVNPTFGSTLQVLAMLPSVVYQSFE